jgi:hypothetical protein
VRRRDQPLSEPQLTLKTNLGEDKKEKTKVTIEREAEIGAKKRPTWASTSMDEQAQDNPSLTPMTILDKEKTKGAIEEQAEIEEKKRLTLASTLIGEQVLDEAGQASLVTQDLASTNQ